MDKKEVCSKASGKKAEFPLTVRGHEIEGGCPVFHVDAPVTIQKLAEAGRFNPNSNCCKQCRKNKNYRRCMSIYESMSIDEKLIVDSILESKTTFGGHTIIDCPHRIPVTQ